MKITEILLKDWRNLSEVKIFPDELINIFIGENAQGKTNILEAINFSSLLKSRASREAELIRWEQSAAIVRINFIKADIAHDLAIEISSTNQRKILLDANMIRPRELVGKLNSVLFSPEDLFMFKGSSSKRRKFIDAQISQASPIYFMDLLRYSRLIEIRNALLKKIRDDYMTESELDLWDEQIAATAKNLIVKRLQTIDKLNKYANSIQLKLSSERENLSIIYDMAHFNPHEITAENFYLELRSHRCKDIRNGHTSFGPHRDDLKFFINDRELQLYGSQGQLRTVALALKLSELKFLYDETGEYPILLLDDVMSELDADRRELLLKFLRHEKIQTLITATDRAYFPKKSFGKFFTVQAGMLV